MGPGSSPRGRREDSPSDKALLVFGEIFRANRHDSRHGLVAVTHHHLFAITDVQDPRDPSTLTGLTAGKVGPSRAGRCSGLGIP